MNIGETIKKLRKQKDMTQEQLAEYLNISTQAVSKWETNLTLPDITLVPMLANIFDVTSDVLLGIDIYAKEKRIQEIIDKAYEHDDKGYGEKALEVLRNGLKEYPNSYRLMLDIIRNIRVKMPARTKEDKKEAVYFCEKILAECTDDFARHEAIRWLCDIYSYSNNADEKEKAEKLAKKMPHSSASVDALLTSIYTGDKKHRMIRSNIYCSLRYLYDNMKFIIHYPLDNGHNPYTAQERIILHKKFIEVINIIFDDGNYGHFRDIPETSYRDIAIYSMQIGDYESAVENLKIASEYAIKRDEECDPEQEYTSLFFKGMRFDEIKSIPSSPNNNSKEFLEFIQRSNDFDPIRHTADFIEIEHNLKKHAKVR
jgi:transcriptional regulator with XRE-family HTH domain